MLTKLGQEIIDILASAPKVKAEAVSNFLSTMDGQSAYEARINCKRDAALYKWNDETVNAIETGIRIATR